MILILMNSYQYHVNIFLYSNIHQYKGVVSIITQKLSNGSRMLLLIVVIFLAAGILLIKKNKVKEPDKTVPAVTAPVVTTPNVSAPDDTESDVAVSDAAEPDVTVPAVTDADQEQAVTETENTAAENTITDNSCESQIKAALMNGTTTAFKLSEESEDFSFDASTLSGILITEDVAASMEPDKIEGFLRQFIGGKIIRITNGAASIDESDHKCSLEVLPDDEGIFMRITQGDTMSVTEGKIEGIIKGDTLTGHAERRITTVIYNIGSGRNEVGDFAVSTKMLAEEEVPPLPPINLKGEANSDDSITLTWEDPNPEGIVKEYDVYRMAIDSSFDTLKIATIPSGTSWTDTSEEAKKQTTMIFYNLVAVSQNGLYSTSSDTAEIKLRFKLD